MTISTIGSHSSSRAGGRFAAAGDGTFEAPGAGEAPGATAAWPSFSRSAALPGLIVDSPTSKRSTANRTGVDESPPWTAAPAVPGLPEGGLVGRGVADGDAPPLGAAPSGKTGVAVYTPSRSVWVNVTAGAPSVPGASSTAEPSGRSTRSSVAPWGTGSETGSPGF